MKKTIYNIFRLFCASTLLLSVYSVQTLANTERCAGWGDIAEYMVLLRQENMPLSEVIGTLEEKGFSPENDAWIIDIAILVYENVPITANEIEKNKVAKALRNQVELICFKELKE